LVRNRLTNRITEGKEKRPGEKRKGQIKESARKGLKRLNGRMSGRQNGTSSFSRLVEKTQGGK